MKIDVTGSREVLSPEDTRPERVTITIELDSRTDDPAGHLWGLLMAGRLANVLRVYAHGQGVPVENDGDLWDLMTDAGRFANRLDTAVNGLMWAARDTHGKTWGTIANALERPRKSVRNIVERVRDAYARNGYWRDADGLHQSEDPEYARLRAAARASELNNRSARDVIENLTDVDLSE